MMKSPYSSICFFFCTIIAIESHNVLKIAEVKQVSFLRKLSPPKTSWVLMRSPPYLLFTVRLCKVQYWVSLISKYQYCWTEKDRFWCNQMDGYLSSFYDFGVDLISSHGTIKVRCIPAIWWHQLSIFFFSNAHRTSYRTFYKLLQFLF
jgi:hypothetical protein